MFLNKNQTDLKNYAIGEAEPLFLFKLVVRAVPGVHEDRQPQDVRRVQAGGLLWEGGAEKGLAQPQGDVQSGHHPHEEDGRQAHHRKGK